MPADPRVLETLQRYWGYDSFRPMQERIIGSVLAGRDVCVVMPTGGGKSLCYQLPAAMHSQKTAIVVSPLIALMQDQVAQLAQMGIPSALLNSSLPASQQAVVERKAREGAYRLLYLSPERLAREDTQAWLERVPILFFAIDEAHCISEWGHEFRPEYRQLSRLRARFARPAIAAFTASATRTVRHDIVRQLGLREAHKYIASFHRPNLRYLARMCDTRSQPGLLLRGLRSYRTGSVIVYAPTIAKVEDTVALLESQGIAAIGYHGRMDAQTRRENQERWMSDEVRVLVGTVAFGLGINKPGVRAVIHLSLPKSIEQYYQEAGRAGRDGLPADCVLLWQKRDAGLLVHFIEQMTDTEEQRRGWDRYHEVRRFAESGRCRHRQICTHFGETPKWTTCQACDACGVALKWLREQPETISGRRRPARGRKKQPAPVATPSRKSAQPRRVAAASAENLKPGLREELRRWRRETAKEKGIPAFVVLHDTTLDDLCRLRPRSLTELRAVHGIGERKAEQFGEDILDVVRQSAM